MLKRSLFVLALLAALTICATAQNKPAPASAPEDAAPKHEPHLEALDWMTHGTWHAEFTTREGKLFTIDNEIRWAPTGTAISFITRFNGEAHYYGIYVWDPQQQKLRFFYTSADGAYTEGATVVTNGDLAQQFTIASAKGVEKLHSTVKRNGEDAYDFAVFNEGSDKPEFTMTYHQR